MRLSATCNKQIFLGDHPSSMSNLHPLSLIFHGLKNQFLYFLYFQLQQPFLNIILLKDKQINLDSMYLWNLYLCEQYIHNTFPMFI